jgi:hypothetical protein
MVARAMTSRVRIDAASGSAVVEVNGVNIADAVTGADIRLEAGRLPEIRLELVTMTNVYFDRVEISIPAETRKALLHLGWTPPTESS